MQWCKANRVVRCHNRFASMEKLFRVVCLLNVLDCSRITETVKKYIIYAFLTSGECLFVAAVPNIQSCDYSAKWTNIKWDGFHKNNESVRRQWNLPAPPRKGISPNCIQYDMIVMVGRWRETQTKKKLIRLHVKNFDTIRWSNRKSSSSSSHSEIRSRLISFVVVLPSSSSKSERGTKEL